ncbi:uncharacterized protein LOC134811776 [Bolinopsis microptera]|uniref:uncharacterized protein LOC134811776 n=1 Tax=Bolinopsis microptera TaxID=2820187 RepID=UPI00307A211A
MSSICASKPNQTTVWCDDFEEDDMRQVTVKGSLVRYSVFVCKLGCKITEDDLSAAISEFLVNNSWNSTEITTVKICRTKSGVSKGYGFIELDDDEACAALIDQKSLKIGSRDVTLSEAVRKHPEEMVLRKEHVELASRNKRRTSKSSDENSERCQVSSCQYGEEHGCVPKGAPLVMSPVPNYPTTAPTSPILLPQQHLFQPSSLTMIQQSGGIMPTNRLVTSSAMMQPSGMMSTMVTPAVMSPVASLQNMISPEQGGSSLIGSSSPLLYQGMSPPMMQNCPLLYPSPRAAPLYSPIYYQPFPQYQCIPSNLPRYAYQDPTYCYNYVTSM